MKRLAAATKIAIALDAAALLIMVVSFLYFSSDFYIFQLLLFCTPLALGYLGLLAAVKGFQKKKPALSIALIVTNILLVFFWPILIIGGTLLLGH